MPQKANRHGIAAARVKGWGKSPPRDWQQERHGKPHREQNRIGTVRRETFEGCFRPTVRVGCVRRVATCAQDEWPPRSRREARAIQNPAYRPAGNFLVAIAERDQEVTPEGVPFDSMS
ncbi:hypothetical protein MPL3356_60638 [Mesorhizobium plurifarium]|uniref:Uncharacterized protein n=1 Tax=Mesorhizobium plurifarium TaxID=69974 RepID=A0A090EFM0_MESPL|nr:hypothetical protein MPL3356_60638 [Mesorhizobium plurifarium]